MGTTILTDLFKLRYGALGSISKLDKNRIYDLTASGILKSLDLMVEHTNSNFMTIYLYLLTE